MRDNQVSVFELLFTLGVGVVAACGFSPQNSSFTPERGQKALKEIGTLVTNSLTSSGLPAGQ